MYSSGAYMAPIMGLSFHPEAWKKDRIRGFGWVVAYERIRRRLTGEFAVYKRRLGLLGHHSGCGVVHLRADRAEHLRADPRTALWIPPAERPLPRSSCLPRSSRSAFLWPGRPRLRSRRSRTRTPAGRRGGTGSSTDSALALLNRTSL